MNKLYSYHKNIKKDCFWNEPTVVRITEFNEAGYDKFVKSFEHAMNTGQSIIPVVIDSYGGAVYSLMGMVSTIENAIKSGIPVATILLGKAMSCGAVLFSCGSEGYRYMSSRSTIMVHSVSSVAMGKVDDLEIDVAEAKRLNKEIYDIMEHNTGNKKGSFLKHIKANYNNSDWFLNPAEAKKWNFANHIGVPSFKIKVSMKTELTL